jgi:hypothetical protein
MITSRIDSLVVKIAGIRRAGILQPTDSWHRLPIKYLQYWILAPHDKTPLQTNAQQHHEYYASGHTELRMNVKYMTLILFVNEGSVI